MKEKFYLPLIFICAACGIYFAGSKKNNQESTPKVIKVETPFPGYMYRPAKEGIYPAIIFLHGSEGGNGDFWHYPKEKIKNKGKNAFAPKFAKDFAKKGYITLALCYFDCENHTGHTDYPPSHLKNVDIKKITGNAIAWLREQPYTNNKLGLLGHSRGAEHALLYTSLIEASASIYPDAVVSLSPSNNITREFSQSTANEIIEKGYSSSWPKKPAWKFGEQTPEIDAPIKIEKFKNPLLITYFSKDPVWGSYVNVRKIIDRISSFEKPYFYIDFNLNDDQQKAINEIKKSSEDIFFINYNFSGHIYPNKIKEKNAFLLQEKTIEWFFDKNLK